MVSAMALTHLLSRCILTINPTSGECRRLSLALISDATQRSPFLSITSINAGNNQCMRPKTIAIRNRQWTKLTSAHLSSRIESSIPVVQYSLSFVPGIISATDALRGTCSENAKQYAPHFRKWIHTGSSSYHQCGKVFTQNSEMNTRTSSNHQTVVIILYHFMVDKAFGGNRIFPRITELNVRNTANVSNHRKVQYSLTIMCRYSTVLVA